jgi:hypothetical protein
MGKRKPGRVRLHTEAWQVLLRARSLTEITKFSSVKKLKTTSPYPNPTASKPRTASTVCTLKRIAESNKSSMCRPLSKLVSKPVA